MSQTHTVEVTKELFQKVFLVYLISSVQKGVYGSVRLHKLAHNFEINQEDRPFTFIRYNHGPWSPELDESKDLLIAAQWIQCLPTKSAKSQNPLVVYRASIDQETKVLLEKILNGLPNFLPALQKYIDVQAYRPTGELISEAYSTEAMRKARMEEIIVEGRLPDVVKIPGLTPRELEDLRLGMDPTFVHNLSVRLEKAKEHPEYDWRSRVASL